MLRKGRGEEGGVQSFRMLEREEMKEQDCCTGEAEDLREWQSVVFHPEEH